MEAPGHAVGAVWAQIAGGVVSVALGARLAAQTFALPLEWRSGVLALAGASAAVLVGFRRLSGRPVVDITLNLLAFATLSIAVLVASGALTQLRTDLARLRRRRSSAPAVAPEAV